jgi:3-carboxy-cis,cis-muconate cycloisomerase
VPDPAAMARGLNQGQGTLFAEALTFALAKAMPRPEAAIRVAALSQEALTSGTPLLSLAARDFPQTDWAMRLTSAALMGAGPAEARAFARAAAQ